MSERDFEIGSRKFKLNKIDAIKQFHIVRRLGPILGDIIPVASSIKGVMGQESLSEEQKFDAFAKLASPLMSGIAKLSDKDADLVLFGLCSSVEMNNMGAWSRVANDSGLAFQDLKLPEILHIAGRAFAYNLADFFALAPQVSHGQK